MAGKNRQGTTPEEDLLNSEQGLAPEALSSGDDRRPRASSGDDRQPRASSGDDR
jgi:hypothetical protein